MFFHILAILNLQCNVPVTKTNMVVIICKIHTNIVNVNVCLLVCLFELVINKYQSKDCVMFGQNKHLTQLKLLVKDSTFFYSNYF